ncbi:MAG: L-alanine exporter AlaE [Ponticaulis sp.]|nr:L-alanine exporter AlaE [Ponticaulis sp.]
MKLKEFVADTLALVSFFTAFGALNEHYVGGMSWPEVLHARLIGAPLMVLTARPYGVWRDHFLNWTSPPLPSVVSDGIALLSFQVPIYLGIIWVSGADTAALVKAGAFFSVMMFVLGKPYGLWLDFIRKIFGLSKGGMKPMSPQG